MFYHMLLKLGIFLLKRGKQKDMTLCQDNRSIPCLSCDDLMRLFG